MDKKLSLFIRSWFSFLFVFLVFSLCLGVTLPVLAEDEEDSEEFTLEEITVTAEKREAELQKVPMDISVVRPEEMDRLGITTAYDLKKVLPDIDTESATGNQVILSVRDVGLQQNVLWNPIHETSTAVHLDGVQMTRSIGFDSLFFDLQRVEVLKGPQGTLYGRGSTGGSMNISTQKPILGEISGNVGLEYGNFGKKRADAALNIPIAEKLAARISGRKIERNGYSDTGFNDQNSWGARVSLTWEPSSKDTITMTYDAEGSRTHGYKTDGNYWSVYSSDPDFAWFHAQTDPTVETDADTGDQYFGDPNVPDLFPQTWNTKVINLPNQSAWYLGNASDLSSVVNKGWGVMGQWEHEFDFAYGVAVYGHRVVRDKNAFISVQSPSPYPYRPYYTYEAAPGADLLDADGNPLYFDADGNPFVDANGDLIETNDQYFGGFALYGWAPPTTLGSYSRTFAHFDSMEVRLLSKETITGGDKYEWVVGALGQNDKVVEDAYIANIHWVEINTNSYGLFAQAAYQIYKNLNLSVGYRYSLDQKEYYGIYPGSWGTDPNVNNYPENFPHEFPYVEKSTGDLITAGTTTEAEWSEHTYKINLNWFVTDSVMTFVQYSKGYKTGNMDYHGEALDPEYMDSYEFGFKSRWFNNRLQFNGSAYYYDYKNYSTWVSAYKCKYNVADHPDDPNGDGANTYANDACWDYDSEILGEGESNGTIDSDDYVYNESASISPGGAEQMGANLNLIYLITPRDTFTITGTYSHNEYKDYHVGNAINARYPDNDNVAVTDSYQQSRDGKEFGGAPYRMNFSYSHTTFIGMDMLAFNANAFYNGTGLEQTLAEYTENEYTMPGLPDYWTADASLTYMSSRWVPEGVNWNARFWVNNIFNSAHLSSLYYTDFSYSSIWESYGLPARTGYATGHHITPRTFGVTLTFNF